MSSRRYNLQKKVKDEMSFQILTIKYTLDTDK